VSPRSKREFSNRDSIPSLDYPSGDEMKSYLRTDPKNFTMSLEFKKQIYNPIPIRSSKLSQRKLLHTSGGVPLINHHAFGTRYSKSNVSEMRGELNNTGGSFTTPGSAGTLDLNALLTHNNTATKKLKPLLGITTEEDECNEDPLTAGRGPSPSLHAKKTGKKIFNLASVKSSIE